jgi:hypothetical protein
VAIAMHGEPVAWKLARPVRREGRRNHLPRGRQALCSYSTDWVAEAAPCDLDSGRETAISPAASQRDRSASAGRRKPDLLSREECSGAAGEEVWRSRCRIRRD